MIYCKNCNYQLQSDWEYCPKCNTRVNLQIPPANKENRWEMPQDNAPKLFPPQNGGEFYPRFIAPKITFTETDKAGIKKYIIIYSICLGLAHIIPVITFLLTKSIIPSVSTISLILLILALVTIVSGFILYPQSRAMQVLFWVTIGYIILLVIIIIIVSMCVMACNGLTSWCNSGCNSMCDTCSDTCRALE